MKAENKLSEGGAVALMIICSILLLTLLFVNPLASACGGFATVALIFAPRIKGPAYQSEKGIIVAAGVPVVVGFLVHPGIFIATAFLTWCMLVGLSCSGAVERAAKREE